MSSQTGVCSYCNKTFPLSGLMASYDYKICYDDCGKATWDPKTKTFVTITNVSDAIVNDSPIITSLKTQIDSLQTSVNTLTSRVSTLNSVLKQHAQIYNKNVGTVLLTGAFQSNTY